MVNLFDIDDGPSLINKEMNIAIIDVSFYLNDVDLATDDLIKVRVKEADFICLKHHCTNLIITVKD